MTSLYKKIFFFFFVAYNLALVENNDAPIGGIYDFLVVRRKDDRSSEFVYFLQKFYDFKRVYRVKIARCLVSENNIRPVYQGARNRNALLFSSGELVREVVAFVRKPHKFKDLRHVFLDFSVSPACGLHDERDIFIRGFCREEFVVLEYRSDSPAHLVHLSDADISDFDSVEKNFSVGRRFFTNQKFQKSRFSRARRAHDEDKLLWIYPKIHVFQRNGMMIINFLYVVKKNHFLLSLSNGR